jgi:hypothetical protein
MDDVNILDETNFMIALMSHQDETILAIFGNYYGHREYEYGISKNHCII